MKRELEIKYHHAEIKFSDLDIDEATLKISEVTSREVAEYVFNKEDLIAFKEHVDYLIDRFNIKDREEN